MTLIHLRHASLRILVVIDKVQCWTCVPAEPWKDADTKACHENKTLAERDFSTCTAFKL